MIKSILGGKSKNLFDINANSEKGYYDEQGNFYPNDRFLCFTIDVISNSTYCISTGKLGSVKGIVSFWNNNIFVSAANYGEQTAFAYTVPSGANKLKFVVEANQKYSNIQIELGSTATEYVPHELTSYKSIMKVSDGRFVTSFDERMPCKTKNLFSSSTEVGTLEGGFGGPTVARNFEENKWYQGFTTNGYYDPGNVPDFDIHPNLLYVYSKGAGYGMSRAIKCEPNTKYFISCSYSHISGGEGNVYVGYYDEGGNFISNLNMDMVYKITITTPSNCKWLIINFTTRGVGKVYFSDIQLVKGTTATDYVPYGYV